MALTEQDRQKAIERANAYRQMTEMWAWKDFMEAVNDRKRIEVDKVFSGSFDAEPGKLSFSRGIVSAINELFTDHIGYVIGDGV